MTLTRNKIEKALPKGYGISKAEGVWYFTGEDTASWTSTCSNFCTLDQGTLEQWVEEFEYCRDTNGGTIY